MVEKHNQQEIKEKMDDFTCIWKIFVIKQQFIIKQNINRFDKSYS